MTYMKIILLKDIPKVGKKFEVKNVADGYALNMLIPNGSAQVATPEAIKKADATREKDLTERRVQNELLLKNLEELKKLKITIKGKANDKGHLFAGVTKEMLVEEIKRIGKFTIDADSIKIEKPLKEIGEHKVSLQILDKKTEITVNIESI
jgi:large subunit ribosomal protein L9